jgi:hypothetical protein
VKTVLFLLGFGFLCACPLFVSETMAVENPFGVAIKPLKTDVTLIAVPVRARSIKARGTINALEKPAAEMPPVWTAVVFRVERIVSGDFKVPKGQEVTLLDQMKDAAGDKKFLKLLTMDFERPPEDGADKGWLSMAVADSYASFGIREGEEPAGHQRYKLFLARVHKDPDSYILVKSEKI